MSRVLAIHATDTRHSRHFGVDSRHSRHFCAPFAPFCLAMPAKPPHTRARSNVAVVLSKTRTPPPWNMSTPHHVQNWLRGQHDAVSAATIHNAFPQIAPRTLSRWLQGWIQDGLVVRVGQGKASRYSMPPGSTYPVVSTLPAPAVPSRNAFDGIPLSPDAEEVFRLVSRPLAMRTPVGYQPAFLADYDVAAPYLSAPILRRLEALGDTGQPGLPAGTFAREVLERLLIDLSWASSHLEGNTYTRLDTRELLAHGRVAEGKALVETQMILNHKGAIEFLVEEAATLELGSLYTVRNLHGILSQNLLPDSSDEGRLRTRSVMISGSGYRPLDIPSQIEEALHQTLKKAETIENPWEQSFFLLVHLPYLQPFSDVNKRTARLLANLPLLRRNLCPLTFLDVPPDAYALATLGVYEFTRVELLRDLYVWAYERSAREYTVLQQTLAAPDPLRLQHRDTLREIVQRCVRTPSEPAIEVVHRLLDQLAPHTRDDVLALAMNELRNLHEGNIARYGLRPSEYNTWRQSQRDV